MENKWQEIIQKLKEYQAKNGDWIEVSKFCQIVGTVASTLFGWVKKGYVQYKFKTPLRRVYFLPDIIKIYEAGGLRAFKKQIGR